MKVCVAGLGAVGMPTAEHIHEHGFEVYGYDIRPIHSKKFPVTNSWKDIPDKTQIYVITVSTEWTDDRLNTTAVREVCRKISKRNAKALVCIESTVPVGTSRRINEELNLKILVHTPHRYWKENPLKYGVKQKRVIGALNKESLKRGLEFYSKLEIPLHVAPSIEIAELCKTAENAYRFVQIAFAEELRIICESKNLSFEAVREACNTKWNMEILEAKEGIKGSCLPKDTRYLRSLTDYSYILDGAIKADEHYQGFLGKIA